MARILKHYRTHIFNIVFIYSSSTQNKKIMFVCIGKQNIYKSYILYTSSSFFYAWIQNFSIELSPSASKKDEKIILMSIYRYSKYSSGFVASSVYSGLFEIRDAVCAVHFDSFLPALLPTHTHSKHTYQDRSVHAANVLHENIDVSCLVGHTRHTLSAS